MPSGKPLTLNDVVGESIWSRSIRAEIARIAAFDSTVLITGPSGTGKELIAREIHANSRRSHKPFIPVDCTGMTESLLTSQLFGHVKGAFTGATFNALGCFRAADGGTLFLDELGELKPQLQAKLLRVIQERAVVPVGSYEPIPVNVRIVAATHRDLKELVVSGRFREDLYYRLAVFPLQIPALKDRPEDIAPLAEHLLTQLWREAGLPHAQLTEGALRHLESFDWPGNVRQLRHVLEQAVICAPDGVIDGPLICRILHDAALPTNSPFPADPPHLPGDRASDPGPTHWPTLDELESHHIRITLEATGHHLTRTAKLLGLTRQSLLRRMEKYHIPHKRRRPSADSHPYNC